MGKDEFKKKLLTIIEKQSNVVIKPEEFTTPLPELGIDSLHAVMIANDLEEIFDVIIDDREIKKFINVNSIVDYFEEKYMD